MIAEVAVIYTAFYIALSPSYVNGNCPVQENGTTVVLPYMYKGISSANSEETAIKYAIQTFQARYKYRIAGNFHMVLIFT